MFTSLLIPTATLGRNVSRNSISWKHSRLPQPFAKVSTNCTRPVPNICTATNVSRRSNSWKHLRPNVSRNRIPGNTCVCKINEQPRPQHLHGNKCFQEIDFLETFASKSFQEIELLETFASAKLMNNPVPNICTATNVSRKSISSAAAAQGYASTETKIWKQKSYLIYI